MKGYRRWGGLIFWTWMLSCAACAPSLKPPSLSQSMEKFNDALRWKRNQKAASFVVPMHRLNFMREQEAKGDGRLVIEYRILEVSRVDGKTASAIVQWEFTPPASPVVLKERTVQFWTQVGERWFLLRIEAEEKEKDAEKRPASEFADPKRNPSPR